jgi:hypothetical protein
MKKDRGFVPIGIREYAKLHAKANPDENPSELLARLRSCVSDALKGASCQCGAPIWVVGSVAVGYACFTCITDEAFPSEDYEIDEVLASHLPGKRDRHFHCVRTDGSRTEITGLKLKHEENCRLPSCLDWR